MKKKNKLTILTAVCWVQKTTQTIHKKWNLYLTGSANINSTKKNQVDQECRSEEKQRDCTAGEHTVKCEWASKCADEHGYDVEERMWLAKREGLVITNRAKQRNPASQRTLAEWTLAATRIFTVVPVFHSADT